MKKILQEEVNEAEKSQSKLMKVSTVEWKQASSPGTLVSHLTLSYYNNILVI